MTAVAPGIDRGWDRRDAPREPERPEPEPTPRDARWAALLEGLPDAFVEPDATPESIAALRRRLGMPTVEWAEQRPAEPTDRDRVARRLRELEVEGHGPQRHEGQVIASCFNTPDAVRASDALARTEAVMRARGQQVMGVRVPLDVLPPPLHAQATGYQRIGTGEHAEARPVDLAGGRIEAVYRWDDRSATWNTYTIYPKHGLPTERGPGDAAVR